MGAPSRNDLLNWVNDLLQLNYTKIEQLGSGAAYCQILDSVHFTVPMSKVNFSAKAEHEYVANFKVLQRCFALLKEDKNIPVEKLIKCRMQDNLEFTQWMKTYWDAHFPGGEYDAVSRRKSERGAPVGAPAGGRAPVRRGPSSTNGRSVTGRAPSVASRSGRLSAASGRASPADASAARVNDLTRQLSEMRVDVDGLEKERDFYFQKLRDIEMLVQDVLVADLDEGVVTIFKNIQSILYSTEEGFDAPEGEEEDGEEVY